MNGSQVQYLAGIVWRVTHQDPTESYSTRDARDILVDGGFIAPGSVVTWIGSDLYTATQIDAD